MNKIVKMLSVLAIGGAILSTSAVVFATENTTAADKNNDFKGRPAVEGKMMRGGDRIKGIPEKGIMKNDIETTLKALVSAGTITQDEADKILALSKQEDDARKAEMDKLKNMTEDERKAYFEANKGIAREKKEDIFAKAVTNGILTQESADVAKTKLHEAAEADKKAKLTEGLNGLVTAGTITQEQSDKILALMTTLETNKPVKVTPPASAPKTEKKNPLSALVDDGTLTQAQLDQVSKLLPIGGDHRHGGGFGMDKPAKAEADTTISTEVE